jgi:hypothetical protein
VLFLETFFELRDFVLRHLKAGPAVPLKGGGLGQTTEATDETARRHGEVIFALLGPLNSDGQAVRDEE